MEGSEEEETFVEENSEWIDVHHLDQSSFENSDLLDETFDAKAHSLRSSRRRVQKHSAVVLTSQRMKKFTSNSNDSNTHPNDLIHIIEESEEEIDVLENDHNEQSSFSKHNHNPVQHSPSKAPTLATSLLNKISPNSKKSPTNQTSPPSSSSAPSHDVGVPSHQHHPTNLRNHLLTKNNDRKKPKNKITETQAALMILQWWNQKKQFRLMKFTQDGKWSFKTSIKLLSLILGYRLRKIFKSYEIQKLINSQKDVKRVLHELLEQYIHEPKANSPKTKFPVNTVEQTIDYWLLYLQKLQSTQSILPGADQVLAKSLIKQLLTEREKFMKVLYQDCQWIYFPKPGYRLLNREKFLKKAPVSLGGIHRATAASPSRPVRSASLEKKMQDTPPHVKAAIQPSALHEKAMKKSIKINQPPSSTPNFKLDVLEESLFEDSDQSNPRPLKAAKPLKALVDDSRLAKGKGSPNTSTSVKARSSVDESRGSSSVSNSKSHDSSFHSNRSLSTPAGHGQKNTPAAAISIPRKRNNDGGHIQLEIISGEKLIPAKKGAAKEGNPVADRKPCLKVMFFLPSNSAPGSAPSTLPKSPGNVGDVNNGLRKVFQQAKDYTAMTLNPKWNASFVVNLPFSKSTLRTAIERHQLQHTFNNAAGLSDAEYEIVCKAMLQYWSGGILEIEVYDGERFNEDIFMGKIQLLVTSFLPLIKKFHELEMKGNYTLEKAKPKDRVSGSVSIIAYFHVPEKKYIEEQIIQLLTSIKYQEMEAAANNQQRRGSSRSGRNSILTSEDSSNDDGGNESSSSDIYNQSKQQRRLTQLHLQDGNQGKKALSTRKSLVPKSSNDDYPSAPSPLTIGGSRNPPQPPSSSNGSKTVNAGQSKKIPIPGHSLAAASSHSNNSSNSSISNFMKTLASEKIQSQDNQAILLNDPTLEESYNVRIPNNPPAGTPNYLRTPATMLTPQTEGSGSSASSSIRRPFSARSMSMDPNSTPPPISSLDEIRGSNIHVSSIVSKEAAIESKLTKRHFLQDMAKQLTGLEQLVNQSSERVMAESISNKVISKKISQVIDVNAANNIAATHESTSVHEQKSPVRLPSGYHPRTSFSPANVAPAVTAIKVTDPHPGRASISKGLSSLKSHVNQTVQNLERFLDDIPLIDPEDDDHDSEEDVIREHQKPFAENHPNKHKKAQIQSHNSPIYPTRQQRKPLSPVKEKSSPLKPIYHSSHYDDDEDGGSYDDNAAVMYEEDEDNQFRKHPSREIISPSNSNRKTAISLDSENLEELKLIAKRDDYDSEEEDDDEEDDRNDFEFEEEELIDSDQEYREKRISVRDYPNQHGFKYHDPTSSPSPVKSSPGRFPLSVSTAAIAQAREEHQQLRTPPSKPPFSSHNTPGSGHKVRSPMKEDREEDRRILSSLSYQSSSLDHSVNSASSPPAIPSRSSSKPVYESKSLSQSDIDELSQRVKLLSRLSYSSTDGENTHNSAGMMTSTLSFSKSHDEYMESSLSPSKTSTNNSPMKPATAPNSQSRSKVNNEDRLYSNENLSSPVKKGVAQQKESAVNNTKKDQVKVDQIPAPVSPVRVANAKPVTTPSSIPKFLRSGVKNTLSSIKQSLSRPEVSSSSSPSTKRSSVTRPVPQTNTTASRLAAGRDARSRPGSTKVIKTSLHLEEADL